MHIASLFALQWEAPSNPANFVDLTNKRLLSSWSRLALLCLLFCRRESRHRDPREKKSKCGREKAIPAERVQKERLRVKQPERHRKHHSDREVEQFWRPLRAESRQCG